MIDVLMADIGDALSQLWGANFNFTNTGNYPVFLFLD